MGIFESEEAFLANEAFRERGELRIRGSGGGGGGKGKGGGSGSDAENTLRSKARARMIEAISEGEIEGLVDGERSIFFEQTPVKNADGTYNFKNVVWRQHKGLPDEGHFPGHAGVETPNTVEVQVKASVGPVQRTIVDQNADAVRVILRIPALFHQNKKKGETQTASLSYRIEVRPYQGAWTTAVEKNITNEKCTSPYQIAHRVELPLDGSPWDLRVVRLTPDSDKVELQNDLWWEGYVTIVDGKFTYPFTAAVGLEVNGEDMGQSIPARSFHVKGIKVLVPNNYNPVTRAYTGIWNGTFKRAWTNNPAWIFYDLITNDRYGLGEFISPSIVDKWSLYTIAQYCDQLVPSGYRNGDTGEMIMEPRFTYNGVINNREEAYHVLQAVTAAWRGMAYWSLGQVFATADIPADPVKIVTPANVLGGEFHYSGTALKARHSVCIIKWNDPDDFYRPATEIVINDAMLRRYGWREKSVTFDGCTSRGLAHRYGKWILDVEQNENETVEYNASWDHAEVRPGDIVAISDPTKAQVRAGGRVVSYNSATRIVTLDGAFEATPGESYSLMVAMPNGKLETRTITSWPAANKAVVSTAFSQIIQPDAMYAITGTDIQPRQFRVLSVREEEKNVFKVTALFHDPLKYARVEQDIVFDPLPYTRPKNVAYPPSNLSVREVHYQVGGVQQSRMLFSWTPDQNFLSKSFRVRVITPFDGEINLGMTERNWIELNNAEAGIYKWMVQAISLTGMTSQWAELEYEATGPEGIPLPTVSDIRLADRTGTEFVGRDVRILWDNNFSNSSDPTSDEGAPSSLPSPLYRNNTVKVYETATNKLLRTQNVTSANFAYTYDMNVADSEAQGFDTARRSLRFEITVTDTYGRTSVAESAVFQNSPPPAILPTYSVNGDTIYMTFPKMVDVDFSGFLIWKSIVSGFDPTITDPWTDTDDTHMAIPGQPLTTYYFRFAAYDAFGKDGLNISPELAIATMAAIDFDPPEIPTGLAVTSTINAEGMAEVVATCDPNSEGDLAYYDFQVKIGTGNWVSFPSSTPERSWTVNPGLSLTFRIRAVDALGNASAFSADVAHVSATDSVPPAVPTDLTATGLFRSIWVDWTLGSERDLAHYEVEFTVNGLATIVVVAAPAFIHSDLTAGSSYTYRVRAKDTSGNYSDWSAPVTAVVGQINGADLPADAIISSFAAIDQAFIESAHIVELDAAKIKAGTVLSGSVTVSTSGGNVALEDLGAGGDPAAVINTGVTQIDPGKILVSGTTTLADWRKGGDTTRIDGGALSANTVTANKLEIGSRNITLEGIVFEHNKPAANQASWTAGSVRYTNDAGAVVSKAITAGNTAAWTAGVMYIYWVKDATTFSVTTNAATAFDANNVVMATYRGGIDLDPDYGRTIIDGSTIKTGTVLADQIGANQINSTHVASDSIDANHIKADAINAKHILVADLENMIPNGNFEQTVTPDLWNFVGGTWAAPGGQQRFYQTTGTTPTGSQVLVFDNGVAGGNPAGPSMNMGTKSFMPVTSGDYLAWEICARSGEAVTANGFYYRLVWYDRNKAALSPAYSDLVANSNLTLSYVTRKGQVVVPAAAAFCRAYIYLTLNATTRYLFLDRVSLRKAKGAELVVDGTITTDKLAANSVTADKIDVTSLSAITANIGRVTAGKVADAATDAASKFIIDVANGSLEWFD